MIKYNHFFLLFLQTVVNPNMIVFNHREYQNTDEYSQSNKSKILMPNAKVSFDFELPVTKNFTLVME
jgi:hypothetical protein